MSWKIAFVLSAPVAVLLGGALPLGCSSDACDRADQVIQDCSTQNGMSENVTTPNTALACTSKRVCQASCIENATCTEIQAAFCIGQTLCPTEPSTSPFATCMAGCEGQ
jgi:hypothetical protein